MTENWALPLSADGPWRPRAGARACIERAGSAQAPGCDSPEGEVVARPGGSRAVRDRRRRGSGHWNPVDWRCHSSGKPSGLPETGSRVSQTVLAEGTSPLAGPWRMTVVRWSEGVVDDGEVLEPRGLPASSSTLTAPPVTPDSASSFAERFSAEFMASSLGVGDGKEHAELILYGTAPEATASVTSSGTAPGGSRRRCFDGPKPRRRISGLFPWPAGLKRATVRWTCVDGSAGVLFTRTYRTDSTSSGTFRQRWSPSAAGSRSRSCARPGAPCPSGAPPARARRGPRARARAASSCAFSLRQVVQLLALRARRCSTAASQCLAGEMYSSRITISVPSSASRPSRSQRMLVRRAGSGGRRCGRRRAFAAPFAPPGASPASRERRCGPGRTRRRRAPPRCAAAGCTSPPDPSATARRS